MSKENKIALVATPIVILIGAGLAWAGSQGSLTWSGYPLFALCIALAFVVQWVAFVPAFVYKTEKFFDITGGITFLSVVIFAVFAGLPNNRSWLLAVLISIWAIRLSSFLFMRIHAAGEDSRFREIKQSFFRFLFAWTLQGLWVSFSLAAALAAITAQAKPELDGFALIGFLVWLLGFSLEVIADKQKSDFRAVPENKGKFINTGLWAWSRHPNYFGEIMLWVGVAMIALPTLNGWAWVTLISPLFVTLLLTRISGVPLLEESADKKWGGQANYETYKANTSILIPMPPKK